MWSRTRSTLYAGVFSCVVHIMLLGTAAAVLISLPAQPKPHLRVTLLQRAIPLPAQEPPSGAAEAPKPFIPKAFPRELPPPKPVIQKKHAPQAPRRLPKPAVQPKRLPPPEPPPVVREEPPQVACAVPPSQAEGAPKEEPVVSNAETPSIPGGAGTPSGTPASMNESVTANGGGRGGGEGRKGVGEANGPSATPAYNVNPKPPYPMIARRIGAQGEVLLRVLVRQDGSVGSVELARSSGFALLDESATRTVRDNWRFIPARLGGAPVESWVEVPIKFVLADS